jgi:hypothetical protein
MTPQTVLERMHEMEGHLSLLTVQLLSGSPPGSLFNLFAGAAHYAAIQAGRIREAYDRDPTREIDAIGWSTRCLMETRLLLHYILNKDEHEALAAVHNELTRDDCEIAFGFYHSLEDETAKTDLKNRIGTLPKTPRIDQMAEVSGFTLEYKTYFKFLCKYTHPSMYLLFMSPTEVRKMEFVDLMLEKANDYLAEVCEALNYVVDSLP